MKVKRKISIICFLISIFIVTSSIQVLADTYTKVTSITLNQTQLTLSIGDIYSLTGTISPSNATNQNIIWTSTDTSVVNILNGTIQALKQGVVIITATSSDDISVKAFCTVLVNNSNASITLDKTSDVLSVGGTDFLTATVTPSSSNPNSNSNIINWSSSDSSIVSVVGGRIVGLKPGSAIVSATNYDGTKIASCYVEVKTPITSIILSKTTSNLKVGGSDTLTALLIPPTASTSSITWTSSDSRIVEVHNGVLIGISEGIATITASAGGNITASCNVIVGNPAIPTTSVTLNKLTSNLTVGATDTLTASVLPENATNKDINWRSTNPNIVTVNGGVITAVSAGTAIVIASAADGKSNLACTVTVTAAVKTANTIRLGGADRYGTAIAISQQGWKGTSDYVVIATGQDYPDALSAAPLARKYNAPILLTEKSAIPQNVLTEINRLKVKHAFIIGGTGVVSQVVESQLKALGIAIDRFGGVDRYETSVKIAEAIGNQSGRLMVTNGYQWEEALSVSSIAAKAGVPIVLTDKDIMPASVKEFINKNTSVKTYILGDTDLIDNAVSAQFPSVERIIGNSKYERNINILRKFEGNIDFSSICIATGKDFPDALAGSCLAASLSSAIIMAEDGNLQAVTTQYIKEKLSQINNVYIFGGTGALSDSTIKTLFSTN